MKADARKKQILDAALKAFAEHGYERTSIAIICKKADIARPTLYQYFKDKRSVFRELLESYLLGTHEKIHSRQQAAQDGKALSRRETKQSLHRELFEEISNNRDIYMILFKEAKARNAETEDIVKGMVQGVLHERVREMRSEPGSEAISEKDLEFAAVYMFGGMMQTVEYYLFDQENAFSTQELSERITFIESRIFDREVSNEAKKAS
jgi:TetR/AcrR family transcriptional regulator, fatty acid metabolism regulator protein